MQVFPQKEKIGTLTKSSNSIVQLGSSIITVGAKQYNTSILSLDTSVSGAGGIDNGSLSNNTFYYVYAVVNSGNVILIASSNKIIPTGFTKAKKVGGFFIDNSGDIFNAVSLGRTVNFSDLSVVLTGTLSTNTTYTAIASRKGEKLRIVGDIDWSGAPNAASIEINLPTDLIMKSNISNLISNVTPFGKITLRDISGNFYQADLVYGDNNTLRVRIYNSSGSFVIQNDATESQPFSIASGDSAGFSLEVPIQGWSEDDGDWTQY